MQPTTNELIEQRPDVLMLLAGDQMSEMAYEKFVSGQLSREQLDAAYHLLTEWRRVSGELLDHLMSARIAEVCIIKGDK